MAPFPDRLEHGSGTTLTLEPDRLLVSLVANAANGIDNMLAQQDLQIETAGPQLSDGAPSERLNEGERRIWVRTGSGGVLSDARVTELASAPEIEWVAPVYRVENVEGHGGLVSPLPHVLVISPRDQNTGQLVSRLRQRGMVPVPELSEHLGGLEYWMIPDPSGRNAYELRDLILREDGDVVADAHFETMPMVVPTTLVPNDPLFAQQWNMTQIIAGGAGRTAWDHSTGAAAVTVCVLDSGVDQTHPDLTLASPGVELAGMTAPGSPRGEPIFVLVGLSAARTVSGAMKMSDPCGVALERRSALGACEPEASLVCGSPRSSGLLP